VKIGPFRAYQLLASHIPKLEDNLKLDVAELGVYTREVLLVYIFCHCIWIYDICLQLRKGASGARGDDAANMKQAVVSWITVASVRIG